jgi:hypothetical protein
MREEELEVALKVRTVRSVSTSSRVVALDPDKLERHYL